MAALDRGPWQGRLLLFIQVSLMPSIALQRGIAALDIAQRKIGAVVLSRGSSSQNDDRTESEPNPTLERHKVD